MSRFPERSVVRGIDLPSLDFLQCEDIKAAILRGFSTWAENHRLVSFHDISHTASCATHSAAPDDSCPWELYVTTDDGSEYAKLAAYVLTHRDSSVDPNWFAKSVRASSGVQASGVDAHYRSVMRFQTHLCWYLDATFCYYFQRLEKEHNVDVSLVMRVVLFLLFGLAALKLLTVTLFICAAVCCLKDEDAQLVRKRRGLSARCSAALDYLSSLSPCVTVLTLFFITFPPIFYDRIFLPCWECFDFEAAAAHEMGHVLGFGHPDVLTSENLIAKPDCVLNNATCRDAFQCAELRPYTPDDESIMHSLTQHNPRTCLAPTDLHGLHLLYPLCDELAPTDVSCTKARQNSGWLRLAVVAGVPFTFAVLLVVVPLSFLRYRDKKVMRQLRKENTARKEEILDYQQTVQTMLRNAVSDRVRPMTASLRRQASKVGRPTTASLKQAVGGRAARGRSKDRAKVHPEGDAAEGGKAGGSPKGKSARRQGAGSDEGKPKAEEAKTRSKTKGEKMALEDIEEEAAAPARVVPKKLDAKPKNGYKGPAWPE